FHILGSEYFFFSYFPAPTEIYTLSLHDALPICTAYKPSAFQSVVAQPAMNFTAALHTPLPVSASGATGVELSRVQSPARAASERDRKSTRLNSSHVKISYAVFCLKKKKKSSDKT